MTKVIVRYLFLLLLLIIDPRPMVAQKVASLTVKKFTAEHLADLNIPRYDHAAISLPGGELVVFGGHTTGFIPTPTAEWFDGKVWHLVPMVYTHDQAFFLSLSSGKVLLGGGHDQSLGIGQTFTMETYDPATHTFTGFGCLDRKRCFAAGVELDSGRVLIAGNWYEKDGMELWDGNINNRPLKDVALGRSFPYILRTSDDNAIIFGTHDERDSLLLHPELIDRVKGDAYIDPFLKTWHPLRTPSDYRSWTGFLGKTAQGAYSYIIPVENALGETALALVADGRFSLIPTDHPIPSTFGDKRLTWISRFVVDSVRSCGYLLGADGKGHVYVLRADYAKTLTDTTHTARLQLFIADLPSNYTITSAPMLTAEGDIILAGGCVHDNFSPSSKVLLLPTGTSEDKRASSNILSSLWLWGTAITGLLLLGGIIVYIRARKKEDIPVSEEKGEETENIAAADAECFERLQTYMQSEQRFREPSLRSNDVATGLNISVRDLSACLRRKGYSSFPDYVNALRIDYACTLLRQQPDIKIRALGAASGFASESAFYSAFSNRTGKTPKQWVATQEILTEKDKEK